MEGEEKRQGGDNYNTTTIFTIQFYEKTEKNEQSSGDVHIIREKRCERALEAFVHVGHWAWSISGIGLEVDDGCAVRSVPEAGCETGVGLYLPRELL